MCPEAGGIAALSHALLGSAIWGEGDPGASGGTSPVGRGNADSNSGSVREEFSTLSERSDQHTAENHRRPFPRC